GKQRWNRQDHQRPHRRHQTAARQQGKEDQQTQGRQGPQGTGDGHRDHPAASCVANVKSHGHRNGRGDEENQPAVLQVLGQPGGNASAPRPVKGVRQPGDGVRKNVAHADAPGSGRTGAWGKDGPVFGSASKAVPFLRSLRPPAAARVHGVRRRSSTTRTASMIKARTRIAMMPTTTSVTKVLCKPSVNRIPRWPTPSRGGTLASEMLLTETPRSPAKRTGSDRGRSPWKNRAEGLNPMATAAFRRSSSTESNASMAARTSKATA